MEKIDQIPQSLDYFIKLGAKLKKRIDSEYAICRRNKTLVEKVFLSWINDISHWENEVINKSSFSEGEIYLFINSTSNTRYPDRVNMRYWDIVSALDARIKQLAYLKNKKPFYMEIIGGDKIQQSGDGNLVVKNKPASIPWYQRPFGIFFIGVAIIIVGTFITLKLGWI